MNTFKRENYKSEHAKSSKVRSDTVQSVQQLPGEQIRRLEGIVKASPHRHRPYHGVYREEALVIHCESALHHKFK